LKIIPPSGVSDRRIRTFTFIEAVEKLRVVFTDDDLDSLAKQLGTKYSGRIKSLFVVIDDDQIRDARSRSGGTSSGSTTRVQKRGHPGGEKEGPPSQRTK
jgi:hypothetical protein